MQSNLLVCALLSLACLIAPPSAIANPPAIDPLPASSMNQTVRELLNIDASRALKAEREKLLAGGGRETHTHNIMNTESPVLVEAVQSGTSNLKKVPSVKLTAIYGVGSVVNAELIIDGAPVVFSTGHALAVRGKAQGWKLQRIATPCIDLIEPEGGALRLCSYRTSSVNKGL